MAKLTGSETVQLQKVDITFNAQDTKQVEYGMKATQLTLELSKNLKYLKEVTLKLKEILAENGLNVPYKGIEN